MDLPPPAFLQDNDILKCGCYLSHPQDLGLPFKKALVPLRHIDYSLQIVNSLLKISLSQKYFNPTNSYLSVRYSLPISPQSSIYQFQAEFGDVIIEGIVKEKQQAKKEFEEAKKQGRQVAIGTIDPDSKDIMNFEIGNIPPESEFVVKISMLQQMKITLNTFYELRVPSTISPRYMNHVNGIAKISEHQIKKGQSSGKPDFTWSFKINLRTTRRTIFYNSPSHNIEMISQNEKGNETLLIMKQSQIPNKDFTFIYTTQHFELPSYVLGNTDISSTIMLSFIPKFCDLNVNDAYKASLANQTYETDISTAKGDYIFLLDRSGSMGGARMEKAKEALILFLQSLPEDSYFNVISFGSSSQNLFKESERYKAKALSQAISQIKKMGADLGGTQVYRPLQQLLAEKVKEGYPRQIFLLTDGGVSNTQGVIKLVKNNIKYCRVHTIGIGNGCSLNLINGCAQSGKGKSVLISDSENPSEKIVELLEATLTPLISRINLKYDETHIESITPNPKSIPYILKDDVINFYVTKKGPLTQKQNFSFEYEDSVTKLPYKTSITVDPSNNENFPFVNKMGHLKVLRLLQNSAKDGISIEDQMYYVKVTDFKKQAINYSIKHQVLSQYTAFICVSKKLTDGQFQQFKSYENQQIQMEQPIPQIYQLRSSPRKMKRKCSPKQMQSIDSISSHIQRLSQIGCALQSIQQKSFDRNINFCLSSQKHSIKKRTNIFSSLGNALSSVGSAVSNLFTSNDSDKNANETIDLSLQKSQKQKTIVSQQINVQTILSLQLPNGSWNDKKIINSFSSNPKNAQKLASKFGYDVIITQLVILWLQKYHPQKQYTLILKKAQAWIKKQTQSKSIQDSQLQTLQIL